MRYFLQLAYNGADFHGWQSQPNAISVQATIEKALSMVLRKETLITGAGRTDAGVNAAEMYAHFDVDGELNDTEMLVSRLNSIVGKDISIDGSNGTKTAEKAHLEYVSEEARNMVENQKPTALI